MKARLKPRYIAGIAIVGLLFSFQNCGQMSTSTGANSANSFSDSLPFAYDAKIDTLGYMSCSQMIDAIPNSRAYFTFRASAYSASSGGLNLRSDFLDKVSNMNATDRGNTLIRSQANTNARLTLSMRKRDDFNVPWTAKAPRAGVDIDSFLPPLDSADIAGRLAALQPGVRANYFPGSADKRFMEASIRFADSLDTERKIRGMVGSGIQLSGQSAVTTTYLATTYSASADELNFGVRRPAGTPNSRAYGSGLQVMFNIPSDGGTSEPRTLSSIQEWNLETAQPNPSSWSCNTQFQFKIVRPEDADRVGCSRLPDSDTPAQRAIRRVLRVEDWYVDVANRCVVSKSPAGDYCYGLSGSEAVNYSPGCTNSANNNSRNVCAHYVSVCMKSN
jgi:hypothetical protein